MSTPSNYLELTEQPGETLHPEQSGQTVQECAAFLGVSVCTVRRMIKDGRLPATRTRGPHGLEYRVSLSNLRTVGNMPEQSVPTAERAHPEHTVSGSSEHSAPAAAALIAQLEFLRAQLEESRLAERELRAALATLAGALEREQQRKMPWQPVSLPAAEVRRVKWWPWRRRAG